MQSFRLASAFTLGALAALAIAAAAPEVDDDDRDRDDDEQTVQIDIAQVPAQVLASFLVRSNGVTPTSAERITDDGIDVYALESEGDGVDFEAVLSSAGDIIKTESQIGIDTLPQSVRDALAKAFPGATIAEADDVSLSYFTVELRQGDRTFDAVAFASGDIEMGDDFDDDDEHEDRDGDDD